ncbi:CPBP family intramembrane glutamic endopeptidase [Demequina sediminicola]|uniref:CPBP family intramembrane glutamic endopeptidase n=1 Tax=Demequina sediminicola TaxID=1095026 RepID=UPI0009E5AE85|nr:type II CAAX endopeptidase family protein [Demequina sediminicola]
MNTGVKRTGNASMVRPLVWFFGGLIVTYVAGVAMFWPPAGEQPSQAIFVVLMFAPTVGAILARLFGGGRIQWGRPNLWLLAGLIPAVAVLGVYLLGASIGWDTEDPSLLRAALVAAPAAILSASLSAVGEEIGWRGFLWPMLRGRSGFWVTSLIMMVIWWVYHVPLIILGWYGDVAHLPAFTVAIVGITLFIGVITDRSRAVWPSVVTHGAWNGLVATSFAATEGGERVPAFAGSDELMGEFGWLAAVTILVIGVVAALWHTRTMAGPVTPSK